MDLENEDKLNVCDITQECYDLLTGRIAFLSEYKSGPLMK